MHQSAERAVGLRDVADVLLVLALVVVPVHRRRTLARRCYDSETAMSAEVSTTDLGKNQIIDGKYRVERQLGAGGMGAVYEAIHLGTGRRVALKVIVSSALANEPEVVTRFHREAKASGAIEARLVGLSGASSNANG
jgi:serine/threonine protein kinase